MQVSKAQMLHVHIMGLIFAIFSKRGFFVDIVPLCCKPSLCVTLLLTG